MSLDEHAFERELREALRYVRLVSELDLEGRNYELAREVVRGALRRGFQGGIAKLYPACLVVYLVAEGVHHYDGGTYWRNLSIPGVTDRIIGPQFLRALDALALDTFSHVVSEGAHPFLAPYCSTPASLGTASATSFGSSSRSSPGAPRTPMTC